MMFVAVVPSFMHSLIHSAEVHKFGVEMAERTYNIICSGMAIPLGSLKGKLSVEPVC